MKRTLFTLMFLATFGMALAGPPVDVQIVCGTGEDASLVGVASLVEDQLHVALIDGALEACDENLGVYGIADDATVFTVSYTLEDGVVTDVQVAFDADPAYEPTLTYAEVPEVAVLGKLGAQQNRAMARERATQAHEQATQARERAAEHAGGPNMDVPDDGADGEEEEVEADGEEGDGPPADLPAPATRGRR